jgi:hypothetical protein
MTTTLVRLPNGDLIAHDAKIEAICANSIGGTVIIIGSIHHVCENATPDEIEALFAKAAALPQVGDTITVAARLGTHADRSYNGYSWRVTGRSSTHVRIDPAADDQPHWWTDTRERWLPAAEYEFGHIEPAPPSGSVFIRRGDFTLTVDFPAGMLFACDGDSGVSISAADGAEP